MNADRYVKEILRKVTVDGKTRRRLREDLIQDIEARLAGGQPLSEIITEMGDPSAVAASIQEEYGGYARARTGPEKVLRIGYIGSGVALLACLLPVVYNWVITLVMNIQFRLAGSSPDVTRTISTYTEHTNIHGGAASVGIIGGADGPTAVFVTTNFAPYLIIALFGLLTIGCYASYRLLRRRK